MTERFRTRIAGAAALAVLTLSLAGGTIADAEPDAELSIEGIAGSTNRPMPISSGCANSCPAPPAARSDCLRPLQEIVGCYLPYLWLKKDGSPWLLVVAGVSLALFVWLLSLHPAAAGRVYAAYGGVYVAVALLWLWHIDGVSPTAWDLAGVAVTLAGMGIIVWGGWQV